MTSEHRTSNGWGWFWLIVVIGVLGAGYLYQRDGGQIFGPDGLGQNSLEKIYGFEIESLGGNLFDYHYQLKNGTNNELTETNVTIIFYREDGEKVQLSKYWANWKKKEAKTFKVPRHRYQKFVVQGTAFRGSEKVKIDSFWTYEK